MANLPDPTQQQLNRNHVPVRLYKDLTICTYGGVPILGDTRVFIYRDDKKVDTCLGYRLEMILNKWY